MPDIARLFIESREALRHYVRRMVRSNDSAEEIVQEAFLRTLEKRESVQTPRAFLFSTARNLVTDRSRRERNSPEDVLRDFGGADTLEVVAPLDESLLAEESSQILKQAIERLPPQQQAALSLRVFHGYSFKEIGAILGISWKTVQKHFEVGSHSVRNYVLDRYNGGQDG